MKKEGNVEEGRKIGKRRIKRKARRERRRGRRVESRRRRFACSERLIPLKLFLK